MSQTATLLLAALFVVGAAITLIFLAYNDELSLARNLGEPGRSDREYHQRSHRIR
jgi:hypothetical protein